MTGHGLWHYLDRADGVPAPAPCRRGAANPRRICSQSCGPCCPLHFPPRAGGLPPRSQHRPALPGPRHDRSEAFRTQGEVADRPFEHGRGAGGRRRVLHAQAGHAVRHPEGAGGPRRRDRRHRRARGVAGRLRLPALAGGELPAGPGRHLCQPEPDPAIRAPDRGHHRGADPGAEGGRALLRAPEGQHHQFRGAREGAPQGALRQPDTALSDRALHARDRGPDDQGQDDPGDRPSGADRQGPALPDRGAAAHRQLHNIAHSIEPPGT